MKMTGKEYQLGLEAELHTWTRSGTSDHYYDYTENCWCWKGAGMLTLRTGERIPFLFQSSTHSRCKPVGLDALLRSFSMEIPLLGRGRGSIDVVHEDLWADYLGEKIHLSIKAINDQEKIMPHITINSLYEKDVVQLVDRGIIPDRDGQMHLGLRF